MSFFEQYEPVQTWWTRVPCAGPAPANTLAFLSCVVFDRGRTGTGLFKRTVRFRTQFSIDGYAQQHYDWYVSNTAVSATGSLTLLDASTDFEFLIALDEVRPFLGLDGVLGFECDLASSIDGAGLTAANLRWRHNVHAYVRLWEPATEVPRGRPLAAPPRLGGLDPGVLGSLASQGAMELGRGRRLADVAALYPLNEHRSTERENHERAGCAEPRSRE